MQYFKRLITLIVLSASFFTASAQPSAVPMRPLSDYFLSNKVTLEKGLNCMVITKQKDFNKLFGLATNNKRADAPDFNKEEVLILAEPETNKETTIKFEDATKAGYFIEVNCITKRKNEPLTYTMQPIALVAIPKYTGVNTIRFYEGKRQRLIKEIKAK